MLTERAQDASPQNVQAAVGLVGAAPLMNDVDFQLNITTQGRLTTVEEFENIVVRAQSDGALVRIKDIARVELGAKNSDQSGRYNGRAATGIQIYQLPGANALATAEGVRQALKDLEPRFPEDVAYDVIRYAGAAYLVFLGVKALRSHGEVAGRAPRGSAYRQAIVVQLLNPKVTLFFLAFLPQFVRPENGSVALQLTVLGIIFILLGLVSTLVYAVSAGSLGNFLRRNPVVLKWQGKVVGGIYCALGVRLALQER